MASGNPSPSVTWTRKVLTKSVQKMHGYNKLTHMSNEMRNPCMTIEPFSKYQ